MNKKNTTKRSHKKKPAPKLDADKLARDMAFQLDRKARTLGTQQARDIQQTCAELEPKSVWPEVNHPALDSAALQAMSVVLDLLTRVKDPRTTAEIYLEALRSREAVNLALGQKIVAKNNINQHVEDDTAYVAKSEELKKNEATRMVSTEELRRDRVEEQRRREFVNLAEPLMPACRETCERCFKPLLAMGSQTTLGKHADDPEWLLDNLRGMVSTAYDVIYAWQPATFSQREWRLDWLSTAEELGAGPNDV